MECDAVWGGDVEGYALIGTADSGRTVRSVCSYRSLNLKAYDTSQDQ